MSAPMKLVFGGPVTERGTAGVQGALCECGCHSPGPEVGQQLGRQRVQSRWELLEAPLTELGLGAGCPYSSSWPSLVWTFE